MMASNPDAVTRQAQEGYKGFCRLVGISTVAIVATLALMALFLI